MALNLQFLAVFVCALVCTSAHSALTFHSFDDICSNNIPNPYDDLDKRQSLEIIEGCPDAKSLALQQCNNYLSIIGATDCSSCVCVDKTPQDVDCYGEVHYLIGTMFQRKFTKSTVKTSEEDCPEMSGSTGVRGSSTNEGDFCISQLDYNNYQSLLNSNSCDSDNDGNPDKCPDGFLSVATQKNGQKGCYEVECPPQGTLSSTVPTSASQYTNSSGIVCDGLCAYDVGSGQKADSSSGFISVSGVSRGQVCGQGIGDQGFTPDDESNNCTVSTNAAGNEQLSCVDAPDIPTPDPNSNIDTDSITGNRVDESDSEAPPTDPCVAAGDCDSDSVVEAIKENTKLTAEKLEEIINANIKTQEDLTGKMLDALAELDKSNQYASNDIIEAINRNGVSTVTTISNTSFGHSGSGDGSSSDGGSLTGLDDLTNILTGDGDITDDTTAEQKREQLGLLDKLPEQTYSLDDYSQNYTGLIQNAQACPEKRPVPLTIGGKTYQFELHFQPICDVSEFIGMLLVMMATLSSGALVVRSF
jgi:hypothetical protein